MLKVIYNEDDGYFYIKEDEHVYNIKFVTEEEAYDYMKDMK